MMLHLIKDLYSLDFPNYIYLKDTMGKKFPDNDVLNKKIQTFYNSIKSL